MNECAPLKYSMSICYMPRPGSSMWAEDFQMSTSAAVWGAAVHHPALHFTYLGFLSCAAVLCLHCAVRGEPAVRGSVRLGKPWGLKAPWRRKPALGWAAGGRERANNKAAWIHTGAGQSGAATGVKVKPALGSCQLTSLLDTQTSHSPVLVSCSIQ